MPELSRTVTTAEVNKLTKAVPSDTTGITGADAITNIVSLTGFVNDAKTAGIWNAARVTAILTP